QNTIHLIEIISEVLQCALHVRDHLIWRQILVSIDRAVKGIGRVERVIAPGRIPPAGIPTPITPANQNDHIAVMPPPVTVVMVLPMIVVFRTGRDNGVPFPAPITQSCGALAVEGAPAA